MEHIYPDFNTSYNQIRRFINKLVIETITENKIYLLESIKPIQRILEQINSYLSFENGVEISRLEAINNVHILDLDTSGRHLVLLMCIPAFYPISENTLPKLSPAEADAIEQLLLKEQVVSKPEGIYLVPQAIKLDTFKQVDIQTQILASGIKAFFNPNADIFGLKDIREIAGNDAENNIDDAVFPVVLIEKVTSQDESYFESKIDKLFDVKSNKSILRRCIAKDENTLLQCKPIPIRKAIDYSLQSQLFNVMQQLLQDAQKPDTKIDSYIDVQHESFCLSMDIGADGNSSTEVLGFSLPSIQQGQSIKQYFEALMRNT